MERQLALLAISLTLAGGAQAERVNLPASIWEQPRSGASIVEQVEIRGCVEQLLAEPGTRLFIHFGKGEEQMLQAEELRAWLISLAVDGARIALKSDDESGAGLSLELVDTTLTQDRPTQHERNP